MKVIKIILLVIILMQVSMADAQSNNRSRRKGRNVISNAVTLDQATQKVKDLFEANFDIAHPAKTYDSTRVAIANYANKLDSIIIERLQNYYYEAFYDASDKEMLDSAVIFAFKYLMVDGRKDENVMWQVLIDNYGSDGDSENTTFLLNWFEDVSVLRENAYAENIESLSKKYDDVIHPISFDDWARGYWISVDDKYEQMNFFGNVVLVPKMTPDYFFYISSVKSEAGIIMHRLPTYEWNAKKSDTHWYCYPSTKNYMLRDCQSLFCDTEAKSLRMVYGTKKVHEGNTERTRQNIASNRQWKADMHGKINSSNTSFGNQLAAGVATDVTAGLLDALAISMGAGSVEAEGYEINMSAISPKVMKANITYCRVKESSLGYSSLKGYKPNKHNRFVKWEESDSVIFINPNGKPIFIESLSKDSPLLKEYNEVRKKHNFWRPQYIIPTVTSIGIGAFFIAKGCPLVASDKNNYTKDEIKSRVTRGGIYFAIGTIVPCITIPLVAITISSKRQSAYNKINEKNMDKMRQKAAQFSMSPILNPVDNSIGMNMSVNF